MMQVSPWKIWLHPRKTATELSEALARVDELSAEYSAMKSETERMAKELEERSKKLRDSEAQLMKLSVDATKLDSRNRELEKAAGVQAREIERLTAELQTRLEAEEQIREFESKLSSIESMKAGYETRIRQLKSKLKAAVSSAGSPDRADSELIIDMDPNSVSSQIRSRLDPANRRREAQDEPDWLEELPE